MQFSRRRRRMPRAAGIGFRSITKRPGRHHLDVQAAIRARWCIDIRYGVKLDAVQLMQEWVRDIGSQAGLTAANARINSGAVGVPESRLELEVEFDSFAELEGFWAAIPPTEHKAWSQRMQNLVVHGSPTWEVYRTCPVLAGDEPGPAGQGRGASAAPAPPTIGGASASSTPSSNGSSGGGSGGSSSPWQGRRRSASLAGGSGLLAEPSPEEIQEYSAPQEAPAVGSTRESGLSVVESQADAQVVLDWKGEPMKINPGDRLPFNFR